MKPNKRLAALTVGALAVSGLAAIVTAGAASAATYPLYAQIKLSLQPTPTQLFEWDSGTANTTNPTLSMTVTPSVTTNGTPITVKVTGGTSVTGPQLMNGPAASVAAGSTELDAVVQIGPSGSGTDYTLRGSQNAQAEPPNDGVGTDGTTNSLYNAGWVISSTAGSSTSNSTVTAGAGTDGVNTWAPGTVANTTGNGTVLRGSEGTSSPAAAISLVAPSPATYTTYPVTLKALVLNSVVGSGLGYGIADGFDEVIDTNSTAPYTDLNTNAAGTINPGAIITSGVSVSAQPAPGATADVTNVAPASGGSITPPASNFAIRVGDEFSVASTNNNWTPSSTVHYTVCTTSASSCPPTFVEPVLWAGSPTGTFTGSGASATYTFPTNASGGFTGWTLKAASFSTYSGPGYLTEAYQGAGPGQVYYSTEGVNLITTAVPTVTSVPQTVGLAGYAAVTGTNWYPGEVVNVKDNGSTPGAGSNFTADANGNISGNVQVNSSDATGFTATGASTLTATGGSVTIAKDACQIVSPATSCTTSQSLYATVAAGLLQQAAQGTNLCTSPATSITSATPCNTDDATVGFGKTTSSISGSTVTGNLNTVKVSDARGGTSNWNLTAQLSGDFSTGAGGTIPASDLSATGGTCAPSTAGALINTNPGTPITAATAFSKTSAVTLCSGPTAYNATGSTSGEWNVAVPLAIAVPGGAKTGTYSSVLTITLA